MFGETLMRSFIPAIGLALALALTTYGPARADLATAIAAYDAKDYAAALGEFQKLGRANPEAAYYLGLMHERGEGATANDTVAWNWFKRAADANHVAAQLKVAECYEQGRGVPVSRAEAYKWYLRAAERGDAKAKAKVGLMNIFGQGKRPNFADGVRWLSEAAKAGDPEAQAAIDDLAARGYQVDTEQGDADPKDAKARRALDEVRSLIAPFQNPSLSWRLVTADKLRVVSEGDGYAVILPRARIERGETTVRLGTVRVVLHAKGDDTYEIGITLPNRGTVQMAGRGELASFAFAGQKFTGRWSTRWQTLLDYDARFDGFRLALSAGPMEMSIDRLVARRSLVERAGKQDVSEVLDASGMRLRGGPTGQAFAVSLANMALRNDYRGVDLAGAMQLGPKVGMDWRTGGIDGAKLAGLVKSGAKIPVFMEGISAHAVVDGGTLAGLDGRQLGQLGHAEFRGAVGGLDRTLSDVKVGLSWDALNPADPAISAGVLPTSGVVALGADRFPTQQMLRTLVGAIADGGVGGKSRRVGAAIGKSVDRGVDMAGKALVDAKTEFRIEELSLSASDYGVAAKGGLKPSPQGWGGAFDVQVRDLANLLALADGPLGTATPNASLAVGMASWLAAMKDYGRAQADANGRTVTSFDIRMEPSGKTLVNGRTLPGKPE